LSCATKTAAFERLQRSDQVLFLWRLLGTKRLQRLPCSSVMNFKDETLTGRFSLTESNWPAQRDRRYLHRASDVGIKLIRSTACQRPLCSIGPAQLPARRPSLLCGVNSRRSSWLRSRSSCAPKVFFGSYKKGASSVESVGDLSLNCVSAMTAPRPFSLASQLS